MPIFPNKDVLEGQILEYLSDGRESSTTEIVEFFYTVFEYKPVLVTGQVLKMLYYKTLVRTPHRGVRLPLGPT